MNFACLRFRLALLVSFLTAALPAASQILNFQHVVVVVQENRTPDNLFYVLCVTQESCSTQPTAGQYNIETSHWLDKTAPQGTIDPLTVPLANTYDLSHAHESFLTQCNMNAERVCAMNGAAEMASLCTGTCLSQPAFRYVDNSTGILNPYLEMVREYGWANYMFQTN